MARTAFVTGATGFVGANLVRALLADGWNVRALVRSTGPSIDGLAIERITGDLFTPYLSDAMRGSDAVFHVAAHYSLWRRDREALFRVNVDGTRAVLAAARRAKVRRIVHTSSVAAIGVRREGAADESYQSPPESLVGAYKQSKYFAEREAQRAFAEGADVVIVNPTTPIGPWDARPTPTGEMLVRFLQRRMPAYVRTGLNVVDVAQVAAGHIAAYERGVAGERYILGNENLTLLALLERCSALSGVPTPRVRLPHAVPLAYAAVRELGLARLGIPPDVSFESVRMARQMMYYDATKSVTELGLRPRAVTPAIAAAVTWFREHGYVPAPPPGGG